MTADVESARRDWEDAYGRLESTGREPAQLEALHEQVDAVSAELRKRIGSNFTLRELADEYLRAEAWSREAVSQIPPPAGWPRTLALVEGAAFHLYSRGAVDYEP